MRKEQLDALNLAMDTAKESGDQAAINNVTQQFLQAIADCQMKMSERVKKIERFVDDNSDIPSRLDSIQASIATVTGGVTAMLGRFSKLEEDVSSLKGDFSGVKDEVSDLKDENTKWTATKKTLAVVVGGVVTVVGIAIGVLQIVYH